LVESKGKDSKISRRKFLAYTAAGAVAVGAVAAGAYTFSRSSMPSTPVSTAPVSMEPIKLGFICSLSPPGPYIAGTNVQRGALLAAEHINAAGGVLGGRKIQVISEDDNAAPEKGLAAVTKLATQDKVVAVSGLMMSSVALAIQSACEQYGIPMLIAGAGNPDITAKGFKTTFRAHITDIDRVYALLNFAKSMGFKKFAIIAEDSDWGIGIVKYIDQFKPQIYPDAETKSKVFSRKSVDITPELLEIAAWKPDVLLEGASQMFFYMVCKQSREVGLTKKIPFLVAAPELNQTGAWEAVGEAGVGAIQTESYLPQMKLTQQGVKAVTAYKEKYKEDMEYYGLNGYSDVMNIAQAIQAAKSAVPADIVKALETTELERWGSTIRFPTEKGFFYHQASPPVLLTQYTKLNQAPINATIIYPPEKATGKYVAPTTLYP